MPTGRRSADGSDDGGPLRGSEHVHGAGAGPDAAKARGDGRGGELLGVARGLLDALAASEEGSQRGRVGTPRTVRGAARVAYSFDSHRPSSPLAVVHHVGAVLGM